ncbi:MAG: hypothetical protein RIC87_15530 [Kiloniellales bacterium]
MPMTFRDWDALEAYRNSNPDGKHGDGWPDTRPVGIPQEAWGIAVGSRRRHALAEQGKANKSAVERRIHEEKEQHDD